MFDADIFIRSALVDAEQQLFLIDGLRQTVKSGHLHLAALQPSGGPVNAVLHIFPGRRVGRTLVQRHSDGGTQIRLDLHALLRPHENTVAVDMRLEVDAFFFDLP